MKKDPRNQTIWRLRRENADLRRRLAAAYGLTDEEAEIAKLSGIDIKAYAESKHRVADLTSSIWWTRPAMAIIRNSMRERFEAEDRLRDNADRVAFEILEKAWDERIATAMWSADESRRTNVGLLSEQEEETRARMRDTQITDNKHRWIAQQLNAMRADPDKMAMLAKEGLRRGDRDIPASMRATPAPTEMQKLYATIEGSQYHDADAPLSEFSRLQLKDAPQIIAESPRVRLAAPVRPAVTPSRPAAALTTDDIARQVLPEQLRSEAPKTIPSKTVALRGPRS
jgi:hypothetical protein